MTIHMYPEGFRCATHLTWCVSRHLIANVVCSFIQPFPTRSDHPTWKSLTNGALSTDERIYLLTTISSDPNQVNSIRNLSGSDAQALIDDIDEVCSLVISYPERLIKFNSNLYVCQPGAGQSHATGTQKLSALPVRSVRQPGIAPEIDGNSTWSQSSRGPIFS